MLQCTFNLHISGTCWADAVGTVEVLTEPGSCRDSLPSLPRPFTNSEG